MMFSRLPLAAAAQDAHTVLHLLDYVSDPREER
jgi:hypothetical protein